MKKGSRNYNINRPLDESTKKFETELNALLERYSDANIETETFDEKGQIPSMEWLEENDL